MKRALIAALCLTAALPVFAAGGKKAAKPAADAGADADPEKARFEAYLKDRLSKIQDAHKARMDFFDQEREHWETFWTKIRDERRKFEIRMTRQSLDFAESVQTLD